MKKTLSKVLASTREYQQVPERLSYQKFVVFRLHSTHFLFFVQLLKIYRMTSIKMFRIEILPLKSTCKYPGVPASTRTFVFFQHIFYFCPIALRWETLKSCVETPLKVPEISFFSNYLSYFLRSRNCCVKNHRWVPWGTRIFHNNASD